jgi:hypothetical protein
VPALDNLLAEEIPYAHLQCGRARQVALTAAYDPMNYQDFAVTNDGVIFFSQGQLLPEAAGATQVLVPRAAIEPMLLNAPKLVAKIATPGVARK